MDRAEPRGTFIDLEEERRLLTTPVIKVKKGNHKEG